MVRILFVIALVVFSGQQLHSQDIHFTQYYFSPLNTNPAYVGDFDGDFRIVGNHRSQWGAVVDQQFLTSGISFDQNLTIYNHQVAVGGNFAHDQSSIGYLQQNKLELAGSYTKFIKGNELRGGIQFGLLHKGIDYNKYSYPSQFNMDDGYFDNTSMSNMENFAQNNNYRLNVNLGLAWRKKINNKLTPQAGLSFMHINAPKESFNGDNANRFKLRTILDLRANYYFSDKITIVPTILFMNQNKAQELVWGGMVRYKVAANKHKLYDVFGGISSRNGFTRNYDAFNLLVGGTVREFQLGISYDINVSELSSISHYRGAFELSLIYTAKNTKPKLYNVPCDRL